MFDCLVKYSIEALTSSHCAVLLVTCPS